MASAVYTASVFKQFLDSPQTDIATFFKLTDAAAFMGWIGQRKGKYIPNADLLAFRLLAQHSGQTLVRATTDSPVYNSQKIGLIDAVSGVPYVETIASRSPDGRRLRLLVVNKKLDGAVNVSFELKGRTASGDWRVRTLSASAIDAHTGTELPQVPGLRWARQETAAAGSRFNVDSDREVQLRDSTWSPGSPYPLPPCSITAFEIDLR